MIHLVYINTNSSSNHTTTYDDDLVRHRALCYLHWCKLMLTYLFTFNAFLVRITFSAHVNVCFKHRYNKND